MNSCSWLLTPFSWLSVLVFLTHGPYVPYSHTRVTDCRLSVPGSRRHFPYSLPHSPDSWPRVPDNWPPVPYSWHHVPYFRPGVPGSWLHVSGSWPHVPVPWPHVPESRPSFFLIPGVFPTLPHVPNSLPLVAPWFLKSSPIFTFSLALIWHCCTTDSLTPLLQGIDFSPLFRLMGCVFSHPCSAAVPCPFLCSLNCQSLSIDNLSYIAASCRMITLRLTRLCSSGTWSSRRATSKFFLLLIIY